MRYLSYSTTLSKKHKAHIYLKPEWHGETGSHKDKWAKEAIKIAVNAKCEKVVVMSAGNLGLAIAAQAKKHRIECLVIAHYSLPPAYKKLISSHGAKIVKFHEWKEEMPLFRKYVEQGYCPLSLTAAQRKHLDLPGIEGYAVTAQEIVQDLHDAPDVIVMPAGFGDFAEGTLRGFENLRRAGKISHLPKIVLVRASYSEASLARSIVVKASSSYIARVLKETKGKNVFLKNKDFIAAKEEARKEGISLELSSAGVLGALAMMKKELENKTIVLLLTALER